MDTIDWRAQLQPGSRQRNVNEIMSKLNLVRSHDEDESFEVERIAQGIEHKTYAEAISQVDYSEKILFLLLSIDDRSGWRAELQPVSRQRIVHKIMDMLRRHLPFAGPEGLDELRGIAVRFEGKVYTAAASQSGYLRKISLKMLAFEG